MISLVVTTYNQARYIRDALNSVIMQGMTDLQVIVVDDGSSDETLEIARTFESSGFEILSKQNGGPSSALNYGMSRVKGEFVVFLSGDDRLLPDSIAQRVAVLRKGRAAIVSSLPEWIDGNGDPLPDSAHPPLFSHYAFETATDMFAHIYRGGNIICAPSVAMTLTCWNTVGLFNEDLWQLQDYEYWLRACVKDQLFHCIAEPCVAYRWHGRNLSLADSTASEKEMDCVLLSAPDWLDRGRLLDLIWGKDKRELVGDIDLEVLRSLLQLKHSKKSVKDDGIRKLRNIAKDEWHRNSILNSLF